MCRVFSLDVQRPPGEERTHPDWVVDCERQVATLERGLERLLSRPARDRESYWGQEVVKVEGQLAVVQDWLRLVQAERAGETDLGSGGERARQLLHRLEAIIQNRPDDWLHSQVNVPRSHLSLLSYTFTVTRLSSDTIYLTRDTAKVTHVTLSLGWAVTRPRPGQGQIPCRCRLDIEHV